MLVLDCNALEKTIRDGRVITDESLGCGEPGSWG